MTGSLIWSIGAAAGLSAVMLANAWLIETVRYLGAAYLLFLAFKSARRALRPGDAAEPAGFAAGRPARLYMRGLALHLTNPKAILFFGSLHSFGDARRGNRGRSRADRGVHRDPEFSRDVLLRDAVLESGSGAGIS